MCNLVNHCAVLQHAIIWCTRLLVFYMCKYREIYVGRCVVWRNTLRESYCRRRGDLMPTRCCRSCTGYHRSSAWPTNWPFWPTRHVRHLCRNISVDTSRHEVARGHCDRRPRHCCMSHSDELPSANALSSLQHHLSGTLSLSPFRTVTRLHYSNLDLKHICSPLFMLLNCPVRQRLWIHGNMALYKFCIVLYYCIDWFWFSN